MKRTTRNRVMYYNDGAKRDFDGHIWVALIVVACALIAYLIARWDGVYVVAVLTTAGILITVLTRMRAFSPQYDPDLTEDERDRFELNAETKQYMSTNGLGCLITILIVMIALVALMVYWLIRYQTV